MVTMGPLMKAIDTPWFRSILACAVGAWVSAFVFLQLETWLMNSYLSLHDRIRECLHPEWQGVYGLGLDGFVLMVVLGLPAQYLLQKRKLTGLIWPNLVAVVVLTLVIAFLSVTFPGNPDYRMFARLYVAACLAATIFWLIRRPDLDLKQDTPPPTR